MRRIPSVLIFALLISLFAIVVYGQEATVEPTEAESTEVATSAPPAEGDATAVPSTQTPAAEATAAPEAEPTEQTIPVDQQAHYRIAHFVPDGPSVTVEVNGEAQGDETLSFPTVGEWHTVPSGSYSFSILAEDEGNAPVAQFESALETGTWRTIALIGSAANGTVVPFEIVEDYGDLNPGTGGLTMFYAIEGDMMVNFNRNATPYVTELTFPGQIEGGVSLTTLHDDAGVFDFQVVETQNPTTVIADLPQNEILENAYTFMAVVGTADSPQAIVDVTDRSEVNMEVGTLTPPGTLLEAAQADENLTTFAQALQTSGLAEELSGEGQYTIFAPANFVLDAMDATTPEALADLLRYHIVEGKLLSRGVTSAQTLNTLAGTPVTVTIEGNNIYINDAQVIALNIPATNGVIHMINGVLSPAEEG